MLVVDFDSFFQICMNQSCIDLLPLQSYARCPSDSENRECSGRGVSSWLVARFVSLHLPYDGGPFPRYAPTSTPANVTTASWATTARKSRPPSRRRCTRERLTRSRGSRRHPETRRTRHRTSTYVSSLQIIMRIAPVMIILK